MGTLSDRVKALESRYREPTSWSSTSPTTKRPRSVYTTAASSCTFSSAEPSALPTRIIESSTAVLQDTRYPRRACQGPWQSRESRDDFASSPGSKISPPRRYSNQPITLVYAASRRAAGAKTRHSSTTASSARSATTASATPTTTASSSDLKHRRRNYRHGRDRRFDTAGGLQVRKPTRSSPPRSRMPGRTTKMSRSRSSTAGSNPLRGKSFATGTLSCSRRSTQSVYHPNLPTTR